MKDLTSYPTIGSQATYIRSTPEGEVHLGEGIVKAILVDPRGRLTVQVKDGENVYNVDFATINADEGFADEYAKTIDAVAALTKEGNELVKKTVDGYNAQVDALYNELLGCPVALEEAV